MDYDFYSIGMGGIYDLDGFFFEVFIVFLRGENSQVLSLQIRGRNVACDSPLHIQQNGVISPQNLHPHRKFNDA
jgi:hypothetical protein